eukprot:UN30222
MGIIWKYENNEWETVCVVEGHKNELKRIAWSADSKFLCTCSRDKTVWLWELVESHTDIDVEVIAILEGHEQDVKSCCFHPTDLDIIYSTSFDSTIRIWKASEEDEDEWECLHTFGLNMDATYWDLCFDPNNNDRFITVTENSDVILWNKNKNIHKEESENNKIKKQDVVPMNQIR